MKYTIRSMAILAALGLAVAGGGCAAEAGSPGDAPVAGQATVAPAAGRSILRFILI